jgi:hypothetical protein
MNKKQMQALAQLQRAFAACRETKIVFCGMDCDLLAYDESELKAAQETRDLYEAQGVCESEKVNTYNTYKDSGGW